MAESTVLDEVLAALQGAAAYDRNDQAPPATVLWPDKKREWTSLLPVLRTKLRLFTFGGYDDEANSGPAIWLRCSLADTYPGPAVERRDTPVVYLPGIGRDELRTLEELEPSLQPLAELQFRGAYWSHPNGRDWTVAGFLSNREKGLGLLVREDEATREALLRALPQLGRESVDSLRGDWLDADDFDALLTPDTERSLLQWMNDADGFTASCGDAEWAAFRSLGKKDYGLDPETDGVMTAAERMGDRSGAWAGVWNRYAEAPGSFPQIVDLLRRAQPTELVLSHPDSWPALNDQGEDRLRGGLQKLADAAPDDARTLLQELEKEHGERRGWLWASLGQAPLAQTLEHLVTLAELSEEGWRQGDVAALAGLYSEIGWQVDDAVLRCLASVEKADDVVAVKTAADVLYRTWLEQRAKALQKAIAGGVPEPFLADVAEVETGTCVLFTDGLRFDVGQRLRRRLEESGGQVLLETDFAALPTITATAKPAVSPVTDRLASDAGFDPSVASAHTRLTAEWLRKLIVERGWQVLTSETDCGDPSGRAWTECGDIDAYGHSHGWKFARELNVVVGEIAQRVESLLRWGWRQVVVVTDHGWLLLPGGLSKVELPEHLTEQRKGRCARLKPGVSVDFLTLPCRWNPDVSVAYAAGISTFVAGNEYEHGGISPQECFTPRLTVTLAAGAAGAVEIESVKWSGLRCRVKVAGAAHTLRLDVRKKAADASSSLASSPGDFDKGEASVLVADADAIGLAAFIVLIDPSGSVVKQVHTVVGGEA